MIVIRVAQIGLNMKKNGINLYDNVSHVKGLFWMKKMFELDLAQGAVVIFVGDRPTTLITYLHTSAKETRK